MFGLLIANVRFFCGKRDEWGVFEGRFDSLNSNCIVRIIGWYEQKNN